MGGAEFYRQSLRISAPVITGVVLDRTGNFSAAFMLAAGVALVGMLAYGVIVRRIETIDWHATGPTNIIRNSR